MYRFNNDYNRGAHPAILDALARANDDAFGGYGIDEWCNRAEGLILRHLDCPQARVHFLVGGTQANFTGLDCMLRPWEGVLCADTGHIHVHETGALEHIGHKCLALPTHDGKLTAAQVRREAELYERSDIPEHVVAPKVVYISQPTEVGTLYSLAELSDIGDACREHGLYLFVDGARLGYGLAADGADFTLADVAREADMFYIGGTKCGALFGEAVVITNPDLQPGFRNAMKQNGAMLAKGWLLGLQFATLFEDGLYFRITEHAIAQALRIRDAFAAIGVSQYVESPTNQQFFVISDAQMAALAHDFAFHFDHAEAPDRNVVRFCTAWSTADEEVGALVAAIAKLP